MTSDNHGGFFFCNENKYAFVGYFLLQKIILTRIHNKKIFRGGL
jgi:hypothetical protein